MRKKNVNYACMCDEEVIFQLDAEKYIFRLFPIISISQKIFSIFFLTLEKIGIDENGILLP